MIRAGLIAVSLVFTAIWPAETQACVAVKPLSLSQALRSDAVIVARVDAARIVPHPSGGRYLDVDLDNIDLIRGDLREQVKSGRLTVAHRGTSADRKTIMDIVGKTFVIALVWHEEPGELPDLFSFNLFPPPYDMFVVSQPACGYPYFMEYRSGNQAMQDLVEDIRGHKGGG